MPFFKRNDARIYYEVHGEGFPILLIAPGGMRSSIPFWDKVPWNPITQLAPHYRVIAMDQRNAGQSTAPISESDSWQTFTDDQVALLNHLDADQCHVAGMCIGGPYVMGLIKTIPDRIVSAVIFQSIGFSDNRDAFLEMFDGWAAEHDANNTPVSKETWAQFRQTMFGGDFLFNVSEEFVAACRTPLLLLQGDDIYHPKATSLKLAELAPNAQYVEHWKEAHHVSAAKSTVEAFLSSHTPSATND